MASHTPDIAILQQQKRHNLFVYDNMQRAHHGYERIREHGIYKSQAFTVGKFSMFKQNLGKNTIPIPVEDKFRNVPHCVIKGEIFSVESSFFMELDKLKNNMLEFQRMMVEVEVPYREVVFLHNRKEILGPDGEPIFHTVETTSEKIARGKMWMYVGISSYWNQLFDHGYAFSQVGVLEPKNRAKEPYYNFRPSEYSL